MSNNLIPVLVLLTWPFSVSSASDTDHIEMLQRSAANMGGTEHELDENDDDEFDGASCVRMPWGQSCPGNQMINNPSECQRCGQQLNIWRWHGQGNWRDDLRGCEAVHGGIGYNFGGHHSVHSIPGGYGAQRRALAVCKAAPTPSPTPPPTPPPTPQPTPEPTPEPTPSPTESPTDAESPSPSADVSCKPNWTMWKRQQKCVGTSSQKDNDIQDGIPVSACFRLANDRCHQFISYRLDLRRCMTHATCDQPTSDQASRWVVLKQRNEECTEKCSESNSDDEGDSDGGDDSDSDEEDDEDDGKDDTGETESPAPAPSGVCRSKCYKQQEKFMKKGKEIMVWKKVCSKSFCADCPFCADKPDELPSPSPTGVCKPKCQKQYQKFVKKGKEGLGFQRVCKKSFCADCEFCSGNFPTPAPTSPCQDFCQEKYEMFANKGKESEGLQKVCAKFVCSGCDLCNT